ncbi:MAG: alpha/beta hydrolase [bacterium]|nr:alpha/beta hydrolase [bacterium]
MKEMLEVNGDDLEWLYSPDWEYHDYGNCKRHLQMLLPYKREWNQDEKFPIILMIPGSAWHKQELYNDIPKYIKLAERGFAIAVLEYRESDLAKFPAQVEDVSNALTFIDTKAEQFHFDMSRVFLMGNSSGGHIAIMSILLNAHGLCKPLLNIRGVISESGSTDLLVCAKEALPPWMKVRPSTVLLGVDQIEDNEESAQKASCAMYITENVSLPPVLLFHSEKDPVVSVENSRLLYDKLTSTNHEVYYYELSENASHGGTTFFSCKILDIIQNFCEKQ